MKRLIALLLVFAMCFTSLASCKRQDKQDESLPQETVTETVADTEPAFDAGLEKAMEYLRAFYKGSAEKTAMDYTRITKVRIGTTSYDIVWSVDVGEDIIKIVPNEDGTVTVDINEEAIANTTEPIPYVLTATITGSDGRQVTGTWNHLIPAAFDEDSIDIIKAAYALKPGESLEGTHTLTGVIISVDTMYNADYKNITVTIEVKGAEDMPIMCYRLKGTGVDKLAVGDTITVTGVLKNYNGTIEFDAGCILEAVESGGGTAPTAPEDPAEIVKQAFALKSGKSLPYSCTLTGTVTEVNYEYDPNYDNVTVTMLCEGKYIYCYRISGDGADQLNANDIITVTGVLSNYNGTIEFAYGKLVGLVNKAAPTAPSDPKAIVDAAYKLNEGSALPYKATLTGEVIAIQSAWSDTYQNITVVISVEGRENKPIVCYRMKGSGAQNVEVGDMITVKGTLQNYFGTIEFGAGCELLKRVKGEKKEEPKVEAPEDPKEIVDAAYALGPYQTLPYEATLTGKITKINTEWSDEYSNITVTMVVEGREKKPIVCFRLKGEGADTLAKGDVITVTGTLKNYNGTIEFDAGCTLKMVTKSATLNVVDQVYELEPGETLKKKQTLTGEVTSIVKEYDSEKKTVTVTMAVPGRESKPLTCMDLAGEGADQLTVGDIITVTGKLTNADGTYGFAAGCSLDSVVKTALPEDPVEIVKLAYGLADGASLWSKATLTGEVTTIDSPYDSNYKNVTVTIYIDGCDDMPIKCYRMKGDDADKVAVGDIITVTGTLMNYKGTIEFGAGCTLDKRVKGEGTSENNENVEVPEDPKEIVEAAYALKPGRSLPYQASLTGKVLAVQTPWSDVYENITVVIQIDGCEDKPIVCYRLKGDGAKDLAAGDVITVTGTLTNYNGTIEFAAGCTVSDITKGEDSPEEEVEVEVPEDPKEIVDAAYALPNYGVLPYEAVLTGVITEINTPWSEDYSNITVTIAVTDREDKPIMCFRLKGDGAKDLAVGDAITVSGSIKNYNGTIEFDAGCLLKLVVKAEMLDTVDAAYALKSGESLSGTSTLTGYITSVDTAYTADSNCVTVTIAVPGRENDPIACYQLTGEGVETLAVGDLITVNGTLTNDDGTIGFASGCSVDAVVKTELPEDPKEIVKLAYGLADGESLWSKATLTGTITSVDTPYDSSYKNVTVTIAVEGCEDMPIKCYRLKGTHAAYIGVNDVITVTGTLTNYGGTIEFAAGCTLDAIVSSENEIPDDVQPEATEPEATEPPADLTETTIKSGTYVIYGTNGLTMSALAEDKTYGYPYGNKLESYSAKDAMTLTKVTGGVTIKDCYGRYIYMTGTYNSFNVSTEKPSEGHVWQVFTDGDYYYLVNALTGKTLAYSTSYNSWGAYAADALTANHLTALKVKKYVEPEATEPVETEAPKDLSTASISSGNYVISTDGKTFSALSADKTYGYAYANDVASYTAADILTFTKVSGGYTIKDCYGRYIYMTGSYNSFNVSADKPESGHVWKLMTDGTSYYLVNAAMEKTLAYSTAYSSWGAYASLTDAHLSALTVTKHTGEVPEVTVPETTAPAATEPPADLTETTIKSGTYVIYGTNGLTMSALAEDKTYGYPYGNKLESYSAKDAMTLTKVTGGVTIKDCYGRYIYMTGTYNSFNVSTEKPSEGHVWQVFTDGDYYYLINALTGKTLAYSTSYNSWGAYASDALTGNHLTALKVKKYVEPEATEPTETEPAVDDPKADTKLTVAEAIALGTSKDHNTYTTGKYYVTGVITKVYNTQYGNMYITDEDGNSLTVYGTFDADGTNRYDAMETKPVAGDTVTVYGIIGQYNGTAQMKNGWVVEHTAAEPEATDPEAAEPEATDPAADTKLTVAEAIALGTSKDHNTYTEGKYYVTGVITKVYNTTYGNMYIADEDGNTLTVYGTYDSDGTNRYDAMETKPVAGDTVKVYGIIGQYNGNAQMKNGWVVEHTAAEPEATEPETTEPEATEPAVPDPEADTELTIAEAIALGTSKDHNTYTEGKYYVTGVITSVFNTKYGNMYIADEDGNTLTIYGTYDADGTNGYSAMEPQPVAGDTVKVYGIIGQYNGNAQMKNAWVVEHTAAEPEATEPEATGPEATEPEATEPEATEPEATEPEVTEPEATEPEATEPEATEPEATEPEATEPEATEPEMTQKNISNGTYVISADGLTFSALNETYNYGYPKAGDAANVAETDVLTITNSGDGFTIQDCYGRYVYLKGTYTSFNVSTTAPSEGHIWQLMTDGENEYVVNATNGKILAYSVSYNSWGAYAEDALTENHLSAVDVVTYVDSEPEATEPEATEPEATEPEETEPELVEYNVSDGTYVLSNGEKTFKALAEDNTYGYAPAGDAANVAETDVLTITNVDGGFTIQDCYGRYVYMSGTYNNFNVSAELPSEGHIWKFVTDGTNYYLVNVLKEKTLSYSTSYGTWGVYTDVTDNSVIKIIEYTAE